MKTGLRNLLILAFLFSSNLFIAQVELEHIFSENKWVQLNKVLHIDGKTFVAGKANDCSTATVVAFNASGEKEWEVITDGCSDVKNMFFRTSDSILILASRWITACNYIDNDSGPHIFGLDLQGNYVFSTHLSVADYGGLPFEGPYISTNSQDEIIVSNGEKIFWLDNMGDVLTIENYSGDLKNIMTYNDNTLILARSEKISFLNATGELQSELEIDKTILDIKLDGDILIILTADELFYYHLPTSNLNSNNTFTNSISATGISYDDNWVYIWGTDINNFEMAMVGQIEKTNFTPNQFITLDQEKLTITDVQSDQNKLYIVGEINVGEETYWGISMQESFLKTTPIFDNPTYENAIDLSVSNFQVTQPSEVSYYDSVEYVYYFTNNSILFNFDVTNEGTDTVFNFSTLSQEEGGQFCIRFRHFSHFDDVVIPPGETQTFAGGVYSNPFHFVDTIKISAFAPNHKFDGNPTNNTVAGTSFAILVDAKNLIHEEDVDLDIFPNPANDRLNLIFQKEDFTSNEKFQLINLQGQVIYEMNISFEVSTHEISLENYPSGIYFLQYLKDDEIRKVKKVVIEK